MIPTISIISSAARPELWLNLYDSINDTIDFEVVFVGPNSPDYTLPDNFNFIESSVKPVQCWEIATRNAEGKYLTFIPDDVFFIVENALSTMVTEFESYDIDELILSYRYVNSEGLFPLEVHRHINYSNIYMPIGFTILNSYYRHLGGLDKNFIALYWDLDLCFRVVEDGGITALSNVIIKDIDILNCGGLYSEFYQIDQFQTLSRIWPFLPNTPFKRTTPLEPFIDDNILIVSQGPKGRWI